jgi:hypothetical protein
MKNLERRLLRQVRRKLRSYTNNDEFDNNIIYLPFTDYYVVIKLSDNNYVNIYFVNEEEYSYKGNDNYEYYCFIKIEKNIWKYKIKRKLNKRIRLKEDKKLLKNLPKSIQRKYKLDKI